MQRSLFGNTTSTTAGTGGLFGSSTGGGANTTFSFGGQTGQQQQQQTPAATTSGSTGFGTSSFFNKPATTTATASPFGSTQPAAQASPFSFGAGATSNQQQPATTTTGFGGFGSPATTTTTTTTGTGFGGFGGAQSTAGTSLFGGASSTTTPQKTTFSFNTTTINTPAQQQTTTTQSQPFSFNSGGGGSFGFGGQARPTMLGAAQPQAQAPQQAQASVNIDDSMMSTLANPQVYNDERDHIIAKWNQLQVSYGTGKVFFQNSSVDVREDNRFTRFKTIGYSCKTSSKNEDGLICLIINQKEEFIKSNQKSIVDTLHKIFGSNPNLAVVIDSIKSQMEGKTEVVFYINERVSPQSDKTKRVLSSLVFGHLSKQEAPPSAISTLKTTLTVKQQLEQISVVNFYPMIEFTDEQVKSYLEQPPAGLNPLLWEQAKKNNPNAKKLLPIQIIGFQEINKRFKLQQQENEAQKANLGKIASSIEAINAKNKLLKAKIEQFKARNENLEQRVLKVFINYEIRRKLGFPIQENENYLLGILTTFQNDLNSPINKEILRQKFTEFIDMIKSIEQNSSRKATLANKLNLTSGSGAGSANDSMTTTGGAKQYDSNNLNEIYKTLKEEQKAVKSLIEVVNKNIGDLGLIKNDLIIK